MKSCKGGLPTTAGFSFIVLGVLIVGAIAAPWIATHPPHHQELTLRLQGPSWAHPLGLDELGRDIFSRLLYGTRISLITGITVVSVAGFVGLLLGTLAGYLGGMIEVLIMRVIDLFLAFPGILLAIAMVAMLGPSLSNVIIALVAVGWVGYARIARAQTLKFKNEDYILAARSSGVPTRLLIFRHLIPGILPLMAVQASLGVAGAILAEAGLSFLGLGVQPPTASWGTMINAGRSHLLDAPHVALFPGLAILITVMSFNYLGDGLSASQGEARVQRSQDT